MKTKHLQEAMCGWRHDFHLHPELGFKEHRTAEMLLIYWKNLGFRFIGESAEQALSAFCNRATEHGVSDSGQTWTLCRLLSRALASIVLSMTE